MKEESARLEIRQLLDDMSVEAMPETTIRGNGNIINSTVTVRAPRFAESDATPSRPGEPWIESELWRRGEPWRRELLDAVRAKAARLTLTEDQVCEIAAAELRKKVVVLSLARLGADDLARVYEALSARRRPARERSSHK